MVSSQLLYSLPWPPDYPRQLFHVHEFARFLAVRTLFVVLTLAAMSPIYTLVRMEQAAEVMADATKMAASPAGAAMAGGQPLVGMQAEDNTHARTQLDLVLSMSSIALLVFMRSFGMALAENQRLCSQLQSTSDMLRVKRAPLERSHEDVVMRKEE
jgi:hypothetical protein